MKHVVFLFSCIFVLFFAGQLYAGDVIHLSFDTEAGMGKDSSGKGNDGELVGDPEWGKGKFGSGFIQEGESYIEIPVLIGEEGTIELWFSPDWTGGDGKDYRIFDASLGDKYFYIGADNLNQMGIYLEDDPGDRHWHTMISFNETPVEAGEWYHLAATWKFGDIAAFYFNGELGLKTDISGNPLGVLPKFAEASHIGLSTETKYAASNSANGTIDEFKIYSRVLDPDEIKEAMAANVAVRPIEKTAAIWGELKN